MLNLPRWRSISWTVRCPKLNLPRLGPESRMVRVSCVGPSTLEVDIADGSILQDLTVHANAPYRGQFGYQVLNLPRLVPISWMVLCPKLDLPHLGPESWTVRGSCVEPSTLEVDIADGSILQDLTVHANAPYRGRFSIQARTFHA